MFSNCGKDNCGSKNRQKADLSKSRSNKAVDQKFNELIAGTFRVGRKIGAGSYGQIHVGTNVKTNQAVAIKFEKIGNPKDMQLQNENEVYGLLAGKKGFPTVFHFGRYLDFQVLVMEMLGRDLESLYESCGRRFTLKSTIFLMLQLLKRFETIHGVGIIYRDVKPENFMLGQNTNTVFVIDYGLSKPYLDSNGEHVQPSSTRELIGTSRYMSINAHQCKGQSRRDDLEAIGYVFAYFLLGKLPWSGLKAPTFSEHNKMICDIKRSSVPEELLNGHPPEFAHYLNYSRGLQFDSEPNYAKLRLMFKRLFRVQNLKDDGVYDWNRR